MNGNITLSMIKPSAVGDNHTGAILHQINKAGFRIQSIQMLLLSNSQAMDFYRIHQDKPFFSELVDYMCSNPIIVLILEKENAVEDFRKLIGNTNPAIAEEGSIRKLFGLSITKNAIHGSDSDENAIREANFFFSLRERY